MSTRLMYAFIAGMFLMFVGYSLLQQGDNRNPALNLAGAAVLILGGVLFAGSLIMQVRRNRNS
ncbi:MAG: hypothetical protein JNL02_02305 [Saprospiraceae bacterium]|nr:hypothetical protein [Saprospiraceae bacterium]